MKFTKDTTIGELMANAPEKAYVLMEAGMQCIGCFVAETEPLEMACAEFGVDINDLLEELNKEEPDKKEEKKCEKKD